eukprot:COSAG01_NODE_49_length_31891_cov_29.945773_9_plen_37_part_00
MGSRWGALAPLQADRELVLGMHAMYVKSASLYYSWA